jgi:hypothetical protein
MASYESGQYSLGFIDPSDVQSKDLKQMMDWFYNSNYPIAAVHWMQAAIDKRFKVGEQNLYNQFYGQNYQNIQKFFFNLIQRHINMISGHQRKNRKSIVTIPNNDNEDQTVDDYNKVLRWCDDRDGFQEYLSQAFEGALDTGETLLHLYPDYTYDPVSGDLFTDSVEFCNYLIDNYTRKQDLSDCNGIWRRRWTSKQMAKLLLPEYAKEIDKMKTGGMKDGRFCLQAELQNIATNNLFTYDEFYYRTTRPGKIIIDPHTEEAVEWDDSDEDSEEMLKQILTIQPWLQVQKADIPTVKLVIALSGKMVYHGKNLLGIDQYPFIPVQAYIEQDIQNYAWKKRGVIRNLRDAQFLYNVRKVIELQLLQSSLNAGWVYPVDVVTDTKAFRQSSGGDGFLIPLKSGHLPNEIQRIEPVALPQSLLELSQSLSEDITKISGVNEELLGSANDDKAGILSMLRQGAGLTTLQIFFDKLDYAQRLYGKIRLSAIRKNFSRGKLTSILGHAPEEKFFTAHSQKYGIAVEEGNYTTTQRQMELQQLLHFRELGIPIPNSSIIRAAFITNKKLVLQEMQQEQQQQQEQASQQAQQQQKMDDAKIQRLMTQSQTDMAKIDEIEASADLKKAQTEFDLVKSMLELETMDLEMIHRSYQIAMTIKGQNTDNNAQVPVAM